jgi:hypothetical protein
MAKKKATETGSVKALEPRSDAGAAKSGSRVNYEAKMSSIIKKAHDLGVEISELGDIIPNPDDNTRMAGESGVNAAQRIIEYADQYSNILTAGITSKNLELKRSAVVELLPLKNELLHCMEGYKTLNKKLSKSLMSDVKKIFRHVRYLAEVNTPKMKTVYQTLSRLLAPRSKKSGGDNDGSTGDDKK